MKLIYHSTFGSDTPPIRKDGSRMNPIARQDAVRPFTLFIDGIPDRAGLQALAARMAEGHAEQRIELHLGWSICHWRDHFSRKKGLAEALKKLTVELVKVDRVSFFEDSSIAFTFSLYQTIHTISISKSGRPSVAGEYGEMSLVVDMADADEK